MRDDSVRPPRSGKQHLAWVRQQPCCLSDVDGQHCWGQVQAHHPKHERSGAKLKTADAGAIPLCWAHHHAFHQLCEHFRGWTRERLSAWQREQVARMSGGNVGENVF